MQNSIRIVTLCCVISLIGGCGFFSVYKRDQPQGNLITPEMVQQVQQGMTREQVTYIMGAPLMDNPFDADQWDYVYQLHTADGQVYDKRVSLYFQDDRVSYIDTSGDIGTAPPAREQAPPASEATTTPLQPVSPIQSPTPSAGE
ncbi:outer membrane protein assembly factor BamE [Halotalea alkalilenta]|uniref:outer membrane protein assembly factor BamE n=1 Tax=Halotalea alkalilenta TaxID=376489 RepID=UPI000487EB57|nr:outer membrane protein assembly factor BamE [Halotalea alkalilenta]